MKECDEIREVLKLFKLITNAWIISMIGYV